MSNSFSLGISDLQQFQKGKSSSGTGIGRTLSSHANIASKQWFIFRLRNIVQKHLKAIPCKTCNIIKLSVKQFDSIFQNMYIYVDNRGIIFLCLLVSI